MSEFEGLDSQRCLNRERAESVSVSKSVVFIDSLEKVWLG